MFRVQDKAWTRLSVTWFVLSLSLAVRAHPQTDRYDTLAAELQRVSPADEDASADQEFEFSELDRLDREVLVRAVLARNPSVQSARLAWRAALAEYPQVTALDDPMIEYSPAPLSIGSNDVAFGQVIGVSQRLPWPGKLALRGAVALAEAEAARENYDITRQHLALTASLLFDQYYAVERTLELTDEHRRLIEDIKATVEAKFEAGRAPQQEALQADLELSHVLHQDVVLEARRAVIVAQINGLLHRRADLPLPPPPEQIEPILDDLETNEVLREQATRRRPELEAFRAQIRGRESAVDLEARSYYPDFHVMASYNSMWMAEEHQWMVGVALNVPIQLGTRRAAVDQAEARLRQARFDFETGVDEIAVEVEQARQHALESRHVVQIYQQRLLPVAEAQVEAARIGYETGGNSFQALIDAERSLRNVEIQYQQALANLGQRRAELQRAVGQIPGLPYEGNRP